MLSSATWRVKPMFGGADTGAIVGARNAKQVDGVVGGTELRLTVAEIAEIEG